MVLIDLGIALVGISSPAIVLDNRTWLPKTCLLGGECLSMFGHDFSEMYPTLDPCGIFTKVIVSCEIWTSPLEIPSYNLEPKKCDLEDDFCIGNCQ